MSDGEFTYRTAAEETWRIFRIMAEFVEGIDVMSRVGPAVSIFGSSRMTAADPYYAVAEQCARRLVECGFAVITGGGPGVMEGANKGAAEEPEKFSAALVFSTKYDPPQPLLSLGPKSQAIDEQYFGLHHDLGPEEIAKRLGGELVWAKSDGGQWVALIRFERVLAAELERPSRLP